MGSGGVLVKGLEQGTNYRMSQIVDEVLPGHPAGILAGPNIAREVAEGYAAAAVLAMPDQHLAANLANLFRTQDFGRTPPTMWSVSRWRAR